MNEINPYQSPLYEAELVSNPFAALNPQADGIWRKGTTLVMHRGAQLPDVCVKTNNVAQQRVTKKLQWHHPLLVLVLVASPLIYLIVALIVMKRATIQIPVSDAFMRRRLRRILLALSLVLLGIGLFTAGIFAMAGDTARGAVVGTYCIIGGMVVGLIGLIASLLVARILTPARITETHVHLNGVHRDLVARFPQWPYD